MRPISNQKKEDVKHLLQQGATYRKISELTGVSLGAIRTIRQQLHVAIEPNGAGRKCIMSSNDIHVVICKLVSGEYKSVEDASRQLRIAYPNKVTPSAYTIRRELQRRHYKAIKKPYVLPLTRSRCNARFRFAEAYRSWTVEDWKRVVFSDETKVNRLGSDGLHWTWIDPDGKLHQRNVIHTYKHGGGSVMIWGCFCWSGPGFITKIQGTMDSDLYCSILEDEFKQTLEYYGLEVKDIIFQQDNDPKHKSKKAIQWFQDNGVEVLQWPSYSPDLNPIEHMWAELKRKLQLYDELPKSITELWERISYTWNKCMTKEYCQKLIESMPQRIEACYKAKGGFTKY